MELDTEDADIRGPGRPSKVARYTALIQEWLSETPSPPTAVMLRRVRGMEENGLIPKTRGWPRPPERVGKSGFYRLVARLRREGAR